MIRLADLQVLSGERYGYSNPCNVRGIWFKSQEEEGKPWIQIQSFRFPVRLKNTLPAFDVCCFFHLNTQASEFIFLLIFASFLGIGFLPALVSSFFSVNWEFVKTSQSSSGSWAIEKKLTYRGLQSSEK